MSNTANTIYQAIVAHTAWKKRLNELVKTGTSEQDFKMENCEFKQWLDENAQELSQYQHYAKVSKLHKTVHEKAEEIISSTLQGKKSEAQSQMEYGGEFEELSKELVQLLIEWHDIVIGKT
jgi:hypothetical protein